MWLPNPKEWRDFGRPPPSLNPVDDDVEICWLFPFASVLCVSGGVRFRLIGLTRGSLFRLADKLRDGVLKKLRRFPVLPELELVLEGEEVWTPLPCPPEEGEEGRESCLLLLLRRKIGRRDTSVDRREPDSPIEKQRKWGTLAQSPSRVSTDAEQLDKSSLCAHTSYHSLHGGIWKCTMVLELH